jgi:hypothetical protein
MTRIRLLNGVLSTFAVTGALAFGVAQAFASSTPEPNERYCNAVRCADSCGGPGQGGCDGLGRCVCF